jgi:NitT/TauT family transport system ATP-binding protein
MSEPQSVTEPQTGTESDPTTRTDGTDATGAIDIDNLTKIYDPEGEGVVAVDDMDLHIEAEEFVALLGPSGCGKSTVMNCVAGYLEPTEGDVLVDGDHVTGPDPKRGVVFQENRLFPWKTVQENVEFGPQMRDNIEEGRAQSILGEMGLEGFEDAYPSGLSGGMQQRAELARLLANDPDIMLMDEPFSALDALTKEIMQTKLIEVWERDNRTVLFITHDVEEAILLADRVVVMTARPGQVKDVFDVDLDRPRDPEVVTTDRFTELRERALSVIREEAQRALEQEESA